ncbi:MAG: hypothetical protein QOG68_1310, partial [Solirubrobacteraceae bacterium]|nr:hypothetical protein [Solirubrobacteraceae bacterium]
APDVADPELTARLTAADLREIARCRFGAEQLGGARDAYRASLGRRASAEAAVGAALLAVGPVARALNAINRRRRR